MPEKKIVLYMHAGSGNHGCEAIVNSLCHMLKEKPLVITNCEEEDRKYSLAGNGSMLCELAEERHFSRHKLAHVMYYGWRKLTGDEESFIRYRYHAVFDRPLSRYAGRKNGNGKRGKVSGVGTRQTGKPWAAQAEYPLAVSIGGDNYCYDVMVKDLMLANRAFHDRGVKTVLLGCSIEPELLAGREDERNRGYRMGQREVQGGQKNDEKGIGESKKNSGKYQTGQARQENAERDIRIRENREKSGIYAAGQIEKEELVTEKDGGRAEKECIGAAAEDRRKKLAEDMNLYDLIIARESITYEALKKAVPEAKLRLIPDPAFTLGVKELPLPEGFAEGNTIGLNVSPMIQGSEGKAGITMENYKALIEHVIHTTDMQVALIPHVVWDRNDDRKPLKELYGAFRESGRVVWIEDCSCEELKGYIARCRMFIGARTHATIAAYSSLVPTLVVGYSVKAKGIAKDLFGSYENYVLPVQQLQEKDDLIGAFEWLRDYEEDIRQDLYRVMPEYKERALLAGKEVERLWEELNMRQKI